MGRKYIVIAAILMTITPVNRAYAYLDPGSGSLFLQVLLGGIAGLLVILKLYWRRILAFLGTGQKKRS